MLHRQTVSPELLELLTAVSSVPEFSELRLVGGTSLALQIGHRNSTDIDLFGELTLHDKELNMILNNIGSVEQVLSTKSIKTYIVNGIKTDIVNYPYKWLEPPVREDGFTLASKADIAAMKIAAVAQRGSKKDFIDLYFLLEDFSMEQIFEFFEKKITDSSPWMALRSLLYFIDAEKMPMPLMYKNVSWVEIKERIIRETRNYQQSI